MPKYCRECGTELKKDTKFCENCGKNIQENNEPQKEKKKDNTTKCIWGVVLFLVVVFGGTSLILTMTEYELFEFDGFTMEVPRGDNYTLYKSTDSYTWWNEDNTTFVKVPINYDNSEAVKLEAIENGGFTLNDKQLLKDNLEFYSNINKYEFKYMAIIDNGNNKIIISGQDMDDILNMARSYTPL